MKNYLIFDPSRLEKRDPIENPASSEETPAESLHRQFQGNSLTIEVEADFLYAQPSGTTTLHRFRADNKCKSDIVAVVPANLLILEVWKK